MSIRKLVQAKLSQWSSEAVINFSIQVKNGKKPLRVVYPTGLVKWVVFLGYSKDNYPLHPTSWSIHKKLSPEIGDYTPIRSDTIEIYDDTYQSLLSGKYPGLKRLYN